jgi:hypothetical protein
VNQRKELCNLHEKLEQQKSNLLEMIANQRKFLSSLPSHLKSLKKASLPVQQQLGMQHTKKLKQHHAAELLPASLYIAYTQLLGQKEAFGENIEIEIAGSTKDAQIFAKQQAKEENGMYLLACIVVISPLPVSSVLFLLFALAFLFSRTKADDFVMINCLFLMKHVKSAVCPPLPYSCFNSRQ